MPRYRNAVQSLGVPSFPPALRVSPGAWCSSSGHSSQPSLCTGLYSLFLFLKHCLPEMGLGPDQEPLTAALSGSACTHDPVGWGRGRPEELVVPWTPQHVQRRQVYCRPHLPAQVEPAASVPAFQCPLTLKQQRAISHPSALCVCVWFRWPLFYLLLFLWCLLPPTPLSIL